MKKSKTRIFINKSISKNLVLEIENKQHHYLKHVLRAKINDNINIFDGKSGEWQANILKINRDVISIKVVKKVYNFKKSSDTWLIIAPIKQNRMSLAIQKSTELGVSKIIPCLTEFTDIKKVNLKNLQENAIKSSEQCERFDIPKVEKTCGLNELLSDWPKDRKLIYCDEKLKNNEFIIDSLIPLKNIKNKFAVLVGPEGGFSNLEKKMITNNPNVISVSLGKRVLRSDTAITVALYCVQELTL